jgi:hypothetical protein
MSPRIVYVDRSEIRKGRSGDLDRAIADIVRHVGANEPRLLAHDVCFSEDRSSMTVIHVHPDSASLELHLQAVAPLLPPFGDLIRLLTIDVYGTPSNEVLEQLRRKATMLGDATVTVHEHRAGLGQAPTDGRPSHGRDESPARPA